MFFAGQHMCAHEQAKAAGDQEQAAEAAKAFAHYLRRAASCHPNPEVGRKMLREIDEFMEADKGDNQQRHPLLEGASVVLRLPAILVGVVLFSAGTLIYAAGKLIEGLGKLVAAGPEWMWRKVMHNVEEEV